MKWVRCPICFDSVNEKQLKCVKWYDGPDHSEDDIDDVQPEASSSASTTDGFAAVPREGSTLRMRLMQRPQITTLALPRSHTWPSDLIPPHQAPFHFLPDVYNFAKFMLATPSYLIADLTRDLDDLAQERRTLASMGDELGVSFVDAADAKLRHQIAKAAALETAPLGEAVEKALRDQTEIEERVRRQEQRKREEMQAHQPSDVPDEYLALQSSALSGQVHQSLSPAAAGAQAVPNRNPRQRRNINPPPPSTQTYYYYQAASGLPLFLHPLDIKILFSHFNNYAAFPDTITVRIESFAEGTINDDLRKRCKYLAHMPEGADVVFVEADLEGVVGAEGLRSFEAPLKMRKARRKEKGKKDDRAKVRAEEKEREREFTAIANGGMNWGTRTVTRFSAADVEDVQAPEEPAPVPAGAWGARSFAATARAEAQASSRPRPVVNVEEDLDMDEAWHDLEQRSAGGRRKRSNKLVVLGGGGGRRR